MTTIDQIKSFIRSATSGNIRDTIKAYGKVGSNFAKDVKAVDGNINISNYYLELDSNRLAHLADHIQDDGDVRNVPLTQEQAENLTEYIDTYDDIWDVVRRKDGSVRIIVGKKINGHAVIVELVSKGRQSVQPVTAWQNTTEYYLNKYRQNSKTQTINTSHPQEGKISGYKPSAYIGSVPQSAALVNTNSSQNIDADTGNPVSVGADAPSVEAPNCVGAQAANYRQAQRVSQVRANTLENAGLFTDGEKAAAGLRPEGFTYDAEPERQTVERARQRVETAKLSDGGIDSEVEYLREAQQWNGEDLDAAIEILKEKTDLARRNGNYGVVIDLATVVPSVSSKVFAWFWGSETNYPEVILWLRLV